MRGDSDNAISDPVSAGWAALAAGAWPEARAAFASALCAEETGEALEGLAWAAWWLNDAPATFDARERAYRRYRDNVDSQGAGRIAVLLAADHFLRRGEHAVANGWFQRAHHLLDGLAPCAEQAMLGIWESYVAIIFQHDTVSARRLGAQARSLARSIDAIDLEMLAQAALGFATVCEGEIGEGMRLLDEAAAAAVGGEMSDPDAIVTTCCYLISACERVRDYDRAAQWCDRAIRLADRWSYRFMFAYCRSHYAGVLLWRGAWPEAEAELLATTEELAATFPAMAAEGIARLAELRRRQGRVTEAQALLDRLDSQPLRTMGGKLAMLGRAALAFERDDAMTTVQLTERFLRSVPTADRVERVDGLELRARALAAIGDRDTAMQALDELTEIATAIATPALWAKTSLVRAELKVATGELDSARRLLEDAVDLFEEASAPYEASCCRVSLAHLLARSAQPEAARREAQAALARLQELGAAGEVERASTLLNALASRRHDVGSPRGSSSLTRRELEVLRLVAQGMSDKEIGVALGLSKHTAHRHVANILTKLGVPSRAAAVAQMTDQRLL